VNGTIWAIDGTSSGGIHESSNRLEYGAVDEPTRLRMEAALAALDVPCFLVALKIRGYMVVGNAS
jgi:hypothetical protein